jgi:hypothetical protein
MGDLREVGSTCQAPGWKPRLARRPPIAARSLGHATLRIMFRRSLEASVRILRTCAPHRSSASLRALKESRGAASKMQRLDRAAVYARSRPLFLAGCRARSAPQWGTATGMTGRSRPAAAPRRALALRYLAQLFLFLPSMLAISALATGIGATSGRSMLGFALSMGTTGLHVGM